MSGDLLSLARVLSKVENRDSDLSQIMGKIFPNTGKAQVWGITGPPGAGKSTLIDRLTASLRKLGKKVAIVAVDPSSPFSGGALLGDRIRMQAHALDPKVFIRSVGTRGKRGGLSQATQEVVLVLDAAHFDVILVETAGVGQTELDIMKLAQTVVVVLVPESGDSIQVMKAGLMEIADLFVVNKSDRPQADQLVRELVSFVGLKPDEKNTWQVPILKTEALKEGGIKELLDAVQEHQTFLVNSENREKKRLQFLENEVLEILTEELNKKVKTVFNSAFGKEVLDKLLRQEIDPYRAASIISDKIQ